VRINRFLASAGLGSRRACEELVRSGRILVNNAVVTDLSTQVDPEADIVRVGRKIVRAQSHVHLLLNKPKGYLCTRSDERGRKTIFDLVPPQRGRLFHVGRLDMESEGLIVLTNDGDFAEALTHPSHQIDKEYEVTVDKPFDAALVPKLLRGVTLESGRARMEAVHPISPTKLKVILRQGLKRQIREMLWRIGGFNVEKLVRVRIGPLTDPRLKPGYWRPLDREEIASLREAATPKPRAKRPPSAAKASREISESDAAPSTRTPRPKGSRKL
jgi:23S rRNA pseudouridine2605 synthase